MKFAPANAIAEEFLRLIYGDLGHPQTGEALLLINGFGDAPLMELYVMYNAARRWLEQRGIRVVRSLVVSFVTSLDTVCLLDAEMTELWDSPVHTAALRW